MGTSLNWIIERQHVSGAWYGVTSKRWCYHRAQRSEVSYSEMGQKDWFRFGERRYNLFILLSNIRPETVENARPLLTPGYPDNPSHATKVDLFVSESHTPGYASLGDLEARAKKMANRKIGYPTKHGGSYPNNRHLWQDDFLPQLSDHLAALHGILSDPEMISQVIMSDGSESSEYLPAYSAHERLDLVEIGSSLLPVGPDSLRILYAYND